VDTIEADAAGTVYARWGDLSLRSDDVAGAWADLDVPFYTESRHLEANQAVPGLLYESGVGYDIDNGLPYVIVSENGAGTWSPPLGSLPEGLPFHYATCLAAAWNETRVYAFYADDIYRSDDANQSYALVHTGTLFQMAAVDPTDPDRLAGVRRYDPSFQLSEDGGITWAPRAVGLPADDPVLVEFDPSNPDRIAVVFDDQGAWITNDAGLSWNPAFDVEAKVLGADWDPVSGYFYISTQTAGVASDDPRLEPAGLPANQVPAIAYLDEDDAVVVGTIGNGIYSQFLDDPTSVEPSEPTSSAFDLRVHPNPGRGEIRIELWSAGKDGVGHGRITIHDSTGRQVREIHHGEVSESGTLMWDAQDARGRPVAAGMYWVRFEARDGKSRAVPITIVH
jgi:hypothetical protein